MNIKTLTPPGGEPLSLADAKAFARIGDDLEDELISKLIGAARSRVEVETGLSLMSRTLRLSLTDWPLGVLEKGALRLPRAPATALIAVQLTDGDASEDVTARFELEDGLCPRLRPAAGYGWVWPRSIHERIEIDWVAGFGTADDVPEDLVHAVKLIVAHGFEHRTANDWRAQDGLNDRLKEVIAPWREVRL